MEGPHERKSSAPPGRRAALVIAHPGHELRVHGWMEQARPVVVVLTDGSGHNGRPRLASTSLVLERVGALPGHIFGRFTDRALYAAILDRNVDLVAKVTEELAQELVDGGIDDVVGDALEGYNPGHDLCRVIIDAAAELAGRAGRQVARFDFALVGRPDECPPELASGASVLTLDDAAFSRKLAAAHTYAELTGEVTATFAETGREAFRIECLRPVREGGPFEDPPYYERYGEQQVSAGYYQRVLRYGEHFKPLRDALRQRIEVTI